MPGAIDDCLDKPSERAMTSPGQAAVQYEMLGLPAAVHLGGSAQASLLMVNHFRGPHLVSHSKQLFSE